MCSCIFFHTFALERSGSSTAVRNFEGVAPPLPFDLNPARQHGNLCTITFHTRPIVGYLLRCFLSGLRKALPVMVFIGWYSSS